MSRISTEMDCELLISEVKKYSELYTHSQFRNSDRKEDIWEEIASVVNKPVEECKVRWRTLRDTYVRNIRKNKASMYYEQLEFLDPFVHSRLEPRRRSSQRYQAATSSQEETAQYVDEVPNDNKDEIEVTNDDTIDFSNIQGFEQEKESMPSLKVEVSDEVLSRTLTGTNKGRTMKGKRKKQRQKLTIASDSRSTRQNNFTRSKLSRVANSTANAVCIDDAPNLRYVDADRLFLLSLLPSFKKLTEHQKLQTKFRILKLLHDAQFPAAQLV